MSENKVLDTKPAIYQVIADAVKAKTGKNIGRSGGQELFNLIVTKVFSAAVSEKTFRFNGGFGSLRLKTYTAGSRQLPSGQKVEFGERVKLRYEEGVAVEALVAGKPLPATVEEPATDAPAVPAGTEPQPTETAAVNLE